MLGLSQGANEGVRGALKGEHGWRWKHMAVVLVVVVKAHRDRLTDYTCVGEI